MPDGSSSALVQGRLRVEVIEFTRLTPVLKVRARVITEPTTADKTTQALMPTPWTCSSDAFRWTGPSRKRRISLQ